MSDPDRPFFVKKDGGSAASIIENSFSPQDWILDSKSLEIFEGCVIGELIVSITTKTSVRYLHQTDKPFAKGFGHRGIILILIVILILILKFSAQGQCKLFCDW